MRRVRKLGAVVALALLTLFALAAPAAAHELGALQVALSWTEQGRLRAELRVDGEHLPPRLVEPEVPWAERGRVACEKAREGVLLAADGKAIAWRPAEEPVVNDPPGSPFWRTALEADLPAGVRELAITQNARFGRFVVVSSKIEGGNAPIRWGHSGRGGSPVPVPVGTEPPVRPWIEVALQYLALGFTHIVPYGLDHVSFVLGLFLLALRLRPLLVQVTCFTLAHTITLGLATLGVVRLPPSIVEPLIALSIAYVGIENLVTKELRPWRPALVFAFGLLHGLGFAGILAEVGIARRELVPALLSFNLGVEAGQLAVLAAAFLLVGLPFGRKPWYRARIAIPGSLAVAALGLFWFAERLAG